MRLFLTTLTVLSCLPLAAQAFAKLGLVRTRSSISPLSMLREGGDDTRRSLFKAAFASALVVIATPAASVAVMDNSSAAAKTFKIGEAMGVEEAKVRFQKARDEINYLNDNYDDIVKKGGGDGVRRYLGTVGVTSSVYGINKVLKELQEEASDIVEFTESMDEFDYSLRAADTACYSALFVEHSSARTKPEKFFQDAKAESKKMVVLMDAMAAELQLK